MHRPEYDLPELRAIRDEARALARRLEAIATRRLPAGVVRNAWRHDAAWDEYAAMLMLDAKHMAEAAEDAVRQSEHADRELDAAWEDEAELAMEMENENG